MSHEAEPSLAGPSKECVDPPPTNSSQKSKNKKRKGVSNQQNGDTSAGAAVKKLKLRLPKVTSTKLSK
jgi:hypothetical protein